MLKMKAFPSASADTVCSCSKITNYNMFRSCTGGDNSLFIYCTLTDYGDRFKANIQWPINQVEVKVIYLIA